MRLVVALPTLALAAALGGCTSSGSALAPVSGSITYNGHPSSRLAKAPTDATFDHQFRDRFVYRWTETYRVLRDRSLEIVRRRRIDDILIGVDD